MYSANTVSSFVGDQHPQPPGSEGQIVHSPETSRCCLELLNTLAPPDFSALRKHAAYRLERVGLDFQIAEDLVQDAMVAVLMGTDRRNKGRHPVRRDLLTKATFMLYLQRVLNSLVEAKFRGREPAGLHTQMFTEDETGDCHCIQISAPPSLAGDAARQDFFREFFRMLRLRAPKHLGPLVNAWEAEYPTAQRIPLANGWRRHRSELREVARQVLREL